MVDTEQKEVYVFCNVCKQNVQLEISEEDIERAKTGLISVISVHGEPQHALMAYLDMNFKARGVEYPSLTQAKESKVEEDFTLADDSLDLNSIVSSFGEKQDQAIQLFARIAGQLIAGNSLYLVHNNTSIGKVVKDQLDMLFPEQKSASFVISYDDIDLVTGMRPSIFDLQYGSFISEGVALESGYFEVLIGDALGSPNGFSILKNDFRKLMYSYRRLWELLSSGARMYTRKRLAYLVSIDLALIPLLLKMAENDGVDVDSRVRLSEAEKKK
ncbi:MAG: hypothetical protein ACXAAO_05920 [Candidatus Thorarchaeota archaeon]|jgi:hypothetical protein